jgi:hypothetical protein
MPACVCACTTPSNAARQSGSSQGRSASRCSSTATPPPSRRVEDGGRAAWALAQLGRAGIAVTSFALGQPSLDEVFLTLTDHLTDDHVRAGKETP